MSNQNPNSEEIRKRIEELFALIFLARKTPDTEPAPTKLRMSESATNNIKKAIDRHPREAIRYSYYVPYQIKSGDTLSGIQERFFGTPNGWRQLFQDNAHTIKNPNLIYVDQLIMINQFRPRYFELIHVDALRLGGQDYVQRCSYDSGVIGFIHQLDGVVYAVHSNGTKQATKITLRELIATREQTKFLTEIVA